MSVSTPLQASVPARNQALDVFRGLTVALMILVNNPGSWSHVYAPLLHAEWHGLTPTDLVFPFFLFIVGSAMAFSFGKHQAAPVAALPALAKRSALIVLIGVLLNWYPFTAEFAQLRLPGVLQRIGIAFFAAGLLVLFLRGAALKAAALGVLVLYGALLASVGENAYTLEHNLVRQVDLAVLGAQHIWGGKGMPFDPEGLLSTLPAVVNVLIGYEVTRVWRAAAYAPSVSLKLAGFALALIGAGLLWAQWQPINKALWTSSYVLVTSGIAILSLLVVDRLLTLAFARRAATPFLAFGLNPLFIYVVSWVWIATYWIFKVDEKNNVSDWMFLQLSGLMAPKNASLFFAVAHVTLFGVMAMVLYRRKIVIKL